MKKLFRFFWAAALAIALIAVAGCGDSGKPAGEKPPAAGSATVKDEAKQIAVKLYFPDANGEKLGLVAAKVAEKDKYAETVRALLAGTSDKNLTSAFPSGVKLESIKVADGLASVSFSPELAKNFSGGSTGELMLAASLANTLTEFPEIKRVQILVGGKKIETLAGHLDLEEPVGRMEKFLPAR